MTITHLNIWDVIKYGLDGIAYAAVIGVVMSWLPPIASLFTIVWLGICIWESRTVKNLISRPHTHVENDNHNK